LLLIWGHAVLVFDTEWMQALLHTFVYLTYATVCSTNLCVLSSWTLTGHGTLYHQRPLRCFMALDLCALPFSLRSYQSASRIWRSLRYFRRVREDLRHLGAAAEALATLQYVEATRRMRCETNG
jgi:hypothetical protein